MTAATTTRGTTNGNARGSSYARAARRAWLVETYRADVDLWLCGEACSYRRNNIRPACGPCNSETGGGLRRNPKETS